SAATTPMTTGASQIKPYSTRGGGMPAKARNSALRAEDAVIFPVEELSPTAAIDEHYSSLYLFRKKMGRKRMRVKTWLAVVTVWRIAVCTPDQREDVAPIATEI